MSDIKFGSFYCYPTMDVTLWPADRKPTLLPTIPKATPFVVLELTTPIWSSIKYLKVLTAKGEIGHVSHAPSFLKKVTEYGS
jgi:hypothetical protein